MSADHPVDSYSFPFDGNRAPEAGSFSYSPEAQRWHWSDAMYSIHGYRRGDIVPTTGLVLRHVHPADRPASLRMAERSLTTGAPFSNYRRLIDATGRERKVLVSGIGVKDRAGHLIVVTGVLTDMSETIRRESEPAARMAVERLERSRGMIDQVKGALMARLHVDETTAFDILSARSQALNVKVRALAAAVVDAMLEQDGDPLAMLLAADNQAPR